MAIDLSKNRETINKQIVDAIMKRIDRGDGDRNVISNLVESIVAHPFVDEELGKLLQETMARVAGEEVVNNPYDDN